MVPSFYIALLTENELWITPLKNFVPEGATDSEYLFCWILDELSKSFTNQPSDYKAWAQCISRCCEQINQRGIFNILLTNGHALFSYFSTSLFWITRKTPFGVAHLEDDDITVDFSTVTDKSGEVTVIATQPLSNNEKGKRWLGVNTVYL
jgi:glutamine amidotransferase